MNALGFLLELQDSCGGAIPVERYMQEALYHPDFGYYARNIRTVGRRGDFSTSATLGKILGSAVAGWIRDQCAAAPARNHVIEVGAGSGALARSILNEIGWFKRRCLRYHIVETSSVLRAEQEDRLRGARIFWHGSMREALDAAGGRALIFSNELMDAFPCRVFERRAGAWFEVGIRLCDGGVHEVLLDRPLPPACSALDTDFPDGQRVEVQPAVGEWMASWSSAARGVDLLTIDYGGAVQEIYHRRPRGSLRAYFHQQRFEGAAVYSRFGKQDLTADVNFTDLQCWGERLGWRVVRFESQGEFIRRYVPARRISASPADVALADLSGAGEAFRVLHQRIG